MAITHVKRAAKSPATGEDDTRAIVAQMLANIEQGGEAFALSLGSATRQPVWISFPVGQQSQRLGQWSRNGGRD